MKRDKDVVLAAVKVDGYSLKYADISLYSDMDIISSAVRSRPEILHWIEYCPLSGTLQWRNVKLQLDAAAYKQAAREALSGLLRHRIAINLTQTLNKSVELSLQCGSVWYSYCVQNGTDEADLIPHQKFDNRKFHLLQYM